ncbi:MAG: hypothetical protein R3A45_04095 [Bdellovibrionota bacterium]
MPQSEGEITSISKSGILFHALTQYRIGISVGIQWKDPDAGIIQGIFNIRSGAKAHDRDGYYFRPAFTS